MNYITNQSDQIIAADDSLLRLLNVESIEELTKQIILGNINFTTLSKQSISIGIEGQTYTFNSHTSILSSMVGSLNLITLEEVTEDSSFIPASDNSSSMDIDKEDTDFEADEAFTFIKEEETPETFISPEEPTLSYDDEIDILSDTDKIEELPTQEAEHPPKTEIKEEPDDALFDLVIPQVPEDTIDEISLPQSEDLVQADNTAPLDTTPIVIDIEKISDTIGISPEDYTLFLDEYIDTAISLEDDLKSPDNEKRSSAIESLMQLSTVLQLPFVNEIMTEISLQPSGNQAETLESFYAILARFVTHGNSIIPQENIQKEPTLNESVSKEPFLDNLILEEPEAKEETILKEVAPEEESSATLETEDKRYDRIDLDNIQPIHFDFQMEKAANDLSLPVELIEEFVHDFIEQAHTETQKMLAAYEKGDLDTIQKAGHMLKGASSNLRINALSDTLYEIQFCDDMTKMKDFIKHYWGHFLSFEQQINNLPSKRN